jgi:hypothetical protein
MTESKYGCVYLYKNIRTPKNNANLILINDEIDLYSMLHNDNEGLVEIVGGKNQKVKPYFDLDQYVSDIDIQEFINDLKFIFPNKKFKYCMRKPRQHMGKIKFSYRIYVMDVKISSFNIKKIIEEHKLKEKYKCIDDSVYNDKGLLYIPMTKYKWLLKDDKPMEVPKLNLMEDATIFECCASHIEEHYEDWDLKMPPIENKKDIKFETKFFDDDTSFDDTLNIYEIVSKFNIQRADNNDTWIKIIITLINLHYRKIISRSKLYEIIHMYSSKSDKYDEFEIDKIIDKYIKIYTTGIGYGIKYLLECLKIDNIEYYNSITKKDRIIESSNDDIGAADIVAIHYKDILVKCNGSFYINYDNIWINNPKQVDDLLSAMISKLDIKYYGADGKRKYSYSRSIKNIKNCIICVKINDNIIINDKFYDDMINNNKFYIPFIDGIYSFINKKLYKYDELPNVKFTFKINRTFPIFNKENYDEMMNRVIIPIYPNEDERIYNAHCKSRALAGCFNDKKWYAYTGSRNSGKGTETIILRKAFGDYVKEFNAKCLIKNKFSNPDVAKALSWVIDKKDARIIISNEIEKDTILNGAFIKSLSGGDMMECRKNFQDEVSFMPQFTMFLCMNELCPIDCDDTIENLIMFNYKSKFVEKHELIEGAQFLKLKDDTIKDLITEDRIIDAYTLYILDAFTNPRMLIPENIRITNEINNIDKPIDIETFIINNYKTTPNKKDRIHTIDITCKLNENNYKITVADTNKLINKIQIGKFNKDTNINKKRLNGFEYIVYIDNEVNADDAVAVRRFIDG